MADTSFQRTRLPIFPGAAGDSLAALLHADAGTGPDLARFLAREKGAVETAVYDHGAILFRGFAVTDADAFEMATRAFSLKPFSYIGGGSPRSRISGEVFTSTEYAAEASIGLHNEASYFAELPAFVWFFCKRAPEVAGETPLGDMRKVLARLDPALVERFDERGLLYLNNLHGGGGFGKSWQQTYQSEDRAEVETRLREKGFDFEWSDGGDLRVRMTAPALRTHPVTGKVYWGNQAPTWHPASLPASTATALRRIYREPINYPKAVFFGDGSTIPDEDILAVAAAQTAEETTFPWQVGDVLLVDNQAIAHGRRPFKGERQIMVALT